MKPCAGPSESSTENRASRRLRGRFVKVLVNCGPAFAWLRHGKLREGQASASGFGGAESDSLCPPELKGHMENLAG
jgi:hypothetical protein